MKKLALLALLASCTSAPKEEPTHQAISDYLRKTMDDPASYQPVSWGRAQVWRKSDEVKSGLDGASETYAFISGKVRTDSIGHTGNNDALNRQVAAALHTPAAKLAQKQRREAQAIRSRDSLRQAMRAMLANTDTTRLGTLVTHVFRQKNKSGALVLDSARFEIDTKGQVKMWDSFKE